MEVLAPVWAPRREEKRFCRRAQKVDLASEEFRPELVLLDTREGQKEYLPSSLSCAAGGDAEQLCP